MCKLNPRKSNHLTVHCTLYSVPIFEYMRKNMCNRICTLALDI